MVSNIFAGLTGLFSPHVLIAMNIGVLAGLVFGSIPGLTVLMCIVLLLPLTFGMDPIVGMVLLLGAYCAGNYAGSITAILINTPGTPAAAATTIEGYKLTKKGKAVKALQMALIASVAAGLISSVVLLVVAPLIARVAVAFGPAEFFALAIFGLTIIISVCSRNLLKGLVSGLVGVFISMIGIDPIMGTPRLAFGSYHLMSGINLVPALVGIFSISEMMNISEDFFKTGTHPKEDRITIRDRIAGEGLTRRELKGSLKTIVKSSFIGTFIGAVPGTGAILSSFLSYNEARRSSKHPEAFGTGTLEGVAATEAGNNGITGATLIPMMTLGIPGDVVTAVMMGALIMHGLPVGPALFTNHAPVTYGIIMSLFFINVFMYVQAKVYIKFFVNIINIDKKLFTVILLVFCVVGAFAVNSSMFDVYVMVAFGLVGYIMQKFDFPLIPLVLALVLGPLAETSLRQALIISQGSYSIFFVKPISAVFLALSALSLIGSLYGSYAVRGKAVEGRPLDTEGR